ncbi:MAG: PDZ domain-containing protein [Planctomycetes bacterium]|nr:PDZ domain-containing protein [Planctomycetota bacterium]MCW8134204.1 PDZ domain-containing protein [Planctomycetota bacterium]
MKLAIPLLLLLLAVPVAAQAKPWLGIKAEVVEAAEANRLGIEGGLKVTRVDKGSPAAVAGVEVGDIVLSAGEKTVKTIEDMQSVMAGMRAGDFLSLGVRRANGRNEPLLVTMGSENDKDDKFKDDNRVKELRERLRELDSERRRVQDELDERLRQLREGKANPETQPQPERPQPETPESPKPEAKPIERTEVKVTLGASFKNLGVEDARKIGLEGGVTVTEVSQGGPAAEAGLQAGDVISHVGGEAVTGTGDLRTILARHKAGDAIELSLLRNGKRQKLTVVLRAR